MRTLAFLLALLGLFTTCDVARGQVDAPMLINQRGAGSPSAALCTTGTVGRLYFQTDAAAGSNIFGCTSAGTWTLQSGGGTAVDIKVGTTTVTSGTNGRILYDNSGVLGEYAVPLPIAQGGTGTATPITYGANPAAIGDSPYASSSGAGASVLWASQGAAGTGILSNGAGIAPSAQFAPGTFISNTVLTSASANFTTSASTTKITVLTCAGGGGGGGTTSAAVQGASGGGGGAGGCVQKTCTVSPSTAYAYTSGAGGTAGSATGPTNGGNGVDSTFNCNGTTITAKAGQGGTAMATGTTTAVANGGAGGTISTNGDWNGAGAGGGLGARFAGTLGNNGGGGSCAYGGGGPATSTAGAGANGIGFCAGGSGGLVENGSTAAAGGIGAAGFHLVTEYH